MQIAQKRRKLKLVLKYLMHNTKMSTEFITLNLCFLQVGQTHSEHLLGLALNLRAGRDTGSCKLLRRGENSSWF
jgi:hypothetical protein